MSAQIHNIQIGEQAECYGANYMINYLYSYLFNQRAAVKSRDA
jgi:hypothetical protein